MVNTTEKLRLIPLGGAGEIGKNMMAVEYNGEILVIDCGLKFPDEDMFGIDLVIPDVSYLVDNMDRVNAIVLTHGHEDHIGALPYVLRQINVPVYGTRLTLGLVEGKLAEHRLLGDAELREVRSGERRKIGAFDVEFIRVNHSIPDAVALGIHTPLGAIVYASDFKFDQTPIGGKTTDFHKFTELGDKGVLLLLSDSTNAERPGYTLSERMVGETFDEVFRGARGRIIVASFASNIYRIQQIIDAALKYKRKVTVVGRSMVNVVNISKTLGYMNIPEGTLVELNNIDKIPPDELVIVTTGSQGEPMSALTRMAMASHRKLSVMPGDTVIISSSPIPGNEKLIARTINHLFKQGAEVVYEAFSGVHVSGHASQEELKLMMNLTRPRFFVPIHGEYRHLVKHTQLAGDVGIPAENMAIIENGDVLQLTIDSMEIIDRVPAGMVLVDGLGVGDVGNAVLRDRRQLSQDGILIVVLVVDVQNGELVAGPDIVSRGFVYVKESEELLEGAREEVRLLMKKWSENNVFEWGSVKSEIRDVLNAYLYTRTKRRPMILPIIMEA